MQGLFVEGRRPKSKKEVKSILLDRPHDVQIEATSVFDTEYNGPASELPSGARISFVGPDPYRDRRFYGTIENHPEKGLRIA